MKSDKRYKVPESPIVQLHWWRLIMDEAQMVGPLSQASVMAGRISAAHRWCVTGTPIGVGQLDDIGQLLRTLRAAPFDTGHVFTTLLARPFLEEAASGGGGGGSALAAVLRVLMWRNSKACVAAEFSLPPRRLQRALLRLSAPEAAFYGNILERTRAARIEWSLAQQQQQQQAIAGTSPAAPAVDASTAATGTACEAPSGDGSEGCEDDVE
eukprot:28977-Chlamydomonas_euryale.AAC.1